MLRKSVFSDNIVISLNERREDFLKLSVISLLIIFIFLDYLTGVLVAILQKKVNSAIGRKGIFNKIGILVCIIFCRLIDLSGIIGVNQILPLVSFFFIMNESFSILENLKRLNVPIPEFLLARLNNVQIKNKKEDK